MLRARGLLLRRLAPLAGQATPSATRLAVRHASAGPVGYGSGPYRGLKPPKVAQWHKNVSVVYGTMLWLWLFYRCKTDGPALIVRTRLPQFTMRVPVAVRRASHSRAMGSCPRQRWPAECTPGGMVHGHSSLTGARAACATAVWQGLEHPWDHGHHGHDDDHGHEHGEEGAEEEH